MKRLTMYTSSGDLNNIVVVDGKTMEECLEFAKSLQRLAEYEDTGLTPEQIREMDKLYAEKCRELEETKESAGANILKKSASFPCALGDTVFDVVLCDDGKYRIFEMKVCNIVPFGDLRKGKVWNVYLEDECSKTYRSFYDFGKTVFHTREEAEAALKRKVGNTE